MKFPDYVAKYSASQTRFVQGDYVGNVDRSGFCAALSLEWCRLVLKSDKGSWSVPKQSATDRLSSLDNKVRALMTEQLLYRAKQTKNREIALRIPNLMKVSTILSKQGYLDEGDRLWHAGQITLKSVKDEVLNVNGIKIAKPLLNLAKQLGVRVKAVLRVTPFKDVEAAKSFVTNHLIEGNAHLLGVGRFHAIAVYRTQGVFSTDYYFFDPNCGEFLCKGSSNAGYALYALLHTVKDYAHYRELFSHLITL